MFIVHTNNVFCTGVVWLAKPGSGLYDKLETLDSTRKLY